MRKLQESKAGGLMPSVLPGSYKLAPFRAAVVDVPLSEGESRVNELVWKSTRASLRILDSSLDIALRSTAR